MNRRSFLLASAAVAFAGWPTNAAAAPATIRASAVMPAAEDLLGVPYIYGGNDPARGIDCSAYVSLIWRIPRQSTDTIHAWSFHIKRNDLMPGDVMNRPYVGRRSHCRVFAGWASEDRSAVWVYEAARGRGVAYRPIAYDDSYTPIRRYSFVADVPLPKPELPVEYEVPGGRFFSQTGEKDGLHGYAVIDDDEAKLWSAFKRHGGVEQIGYPISQRFDWSGTIVQLTQRVALRWLPGDRQADAVSPAGLFSDDRPPPHALAPDLSPLVKPKPA